MKLGWVLEESLQVDISSTAFSFTASDVHVLGLFQASKIRADLTFSPSPAVKLVEVGLTPALALALAL